MESWNRLKMPPCPCHLTDAHLHSISLLLSHSHQFLPRQFSCALLPTTPMSSTLLHHPPSSQTLINRAISYYDIFRWGNHEYTGESHAFTARMWKLPHRWHPRSALKVGLWNGKGAVLTTGSPMCLCCKWINHLQCLRCAHPNKPIAICTRKLFCNGLSFHDPLSLIILSLQRLQNSHPASIYTAL